MVIESGVKSVSDEEIEKIALKVFMKSIEILGGLNRLAEFRSLTWLPALARASIAVVLKEEYLKDEDEIAKRLGISSNSVRNMLRASDSVALEKLRNLENLKEGARKEIKIHTAGGIAKAAYRIVKREMEE